MRRSIALIFLSALVLSACSDAQIQPSEDAVFDGLSYEFETSVEPREGEPSAGKIIIEGNGDYLEEIFMSPTNKEVRSSIVGKLDDNQINTLLTLIGEAQFVRHSDRGGFCENSDRYKLTLRWSDETVLTGAVNHEGFRGVYNGDCGSTNSLRGDMASVHEYLVIGIKETFVR